MAAPPAPTWAAIFFGIHKETVLTQLGDRIQLYRSFIVDVLGIWMVHTDPSEDHRQGKVFEAPMQDSYCLEWILEESLDKENDMYMTIEIRKDWIVMSLYEKAMNLYL